MLLPASCCCLSDDGSGTAHWGPVCARVCACVPVNRRACACAYVKVTTAAALAVQHRGSSSTGAASQRSTKTVQHCDSRLTAVAAGKAESSVQKQAACSLPGQFNCAVISLSVSWRQHQHLHLSRSGFRERVCPCWLVGKGMPQWRCTSSADSSVGAAIRSHWPAGEE